MTKILLLNGPNLNMLGIREPGIYGHTGYEELCTELLEYAKEKDIQLDIEQSNHEGRLIDLIHDSYFNMYDGLIINPGAYTHYSYAIRDALAILKVPIIEVHISNIFEREAFRSVNVIKDVCSDSVIGEGTKGYFIAIDKILAFLAKNS